MRDIRLENFGFGVRENKNNHERVYSVILIMGDIATTMIISLLSALSAPHWRHGIGSIPLPLRRCFKYRWQRFGNRYTADAVYDGVIRSIGRSDGSIESGVLEEENE